MEQKLNLNDNIMVKILDRCYMPELGMSGPFLDFTSISVKNVIELLNNDRTIEFYTAELEEEVFLLVKRYNALVENATNNKKYKKAEEAEKRLYSSLYNKSLEKDLKDQKENLLENPETPEDYLRYKRKLEEIAMRKKIEERKRVKSVYMGKGKQSKQLVLKKPKKTDIFQRTEVEEEKNNLLLTDYDLDID